MKKLLAIMPHGQAYVTLKPNGDAVLTSYQTEAAVLTADNWLTIKDWSSPTTRRHIAAFMDEYCYGISSRREQSMAKTESYQTAKALYEKNWAYNTDTGEIVNL